MRPSWVQYPGEYLTEGNRETVDIDELAARSTDAPPCDTDGDEAAFTTAKAGRDLGWTPEHTRRNAADEDVDGPEFA